MNLPTLASIAITPYILPVPYPCFSTIRATRPCKIILSQPLHLHRTHTVTQLTPLPSGHPSEYLKGYTAASSLRGHGVHVVEANGEDLDSLYSAMCEVVSHQGTAAAVINRPMAPKIKGLEGTPHAHDAVKKWVA
jgi:hypothetical protein